MPMLKVGEVYERQSFPEIGYCIFDPLLRLCHASVSDPDGPGNALAFGY
jgi:hypothetical protein